MGGVSLCQTPGSEVYDSKHCVDYRSPLDIAGKPLPQVVSLMRAKVDRLSLIHI